MTTKEEILALAGEPIGYLHKDVARYDFVHKDVKELWRKCSNTTADRCEFYTIPVFTADQVIAARKPLEEQYASMTKSFFDAQAQLREALAVESKWRVEATALRQQLAAAQAREQQYREALETLAKLGNGNHYGTSDGNWIAQQALTIPVDTSALETMTQKAGEVMRERCWMTMLEHYGCNETGPVADAIRALPGVTLTDLK